MAMAFASVARRSILAASASRPRRGLTGLASRADKVRDRLMNTDWTEEQESLIASANGIISNYRTGYTGQQDETYKAIERLYMTKEAAELTDQLGEAFKGIGRRIMYSTGSLGVQTDQDGVSSEEIKLAFKEFGGFMDSLKDSDVKSKVAKELGQKLVSLRQTSQIDGFSNNFKPIACDHMVTEKD